MSTINCFESINIMIFSVSCLELVLIIMTNLNLLLHYITYTNILYLFYRNERCSNIYCYRILLFSYLINSQFPADLNSSLHSLILKQRKLTLLHNEKKTILLIKILPNSEYGQYPVRIPGSKTYY